MSQRRILWDRRIRCRKQEVWAQNTTWRRWSMRGTRASILCWSRSASSKTKIRTIPTSAELRASSIQSTRTFRRRDSQWWIQQTWSTHQTATRRSAWRTMKKVRRPLTRLYRRERCRPREAMDTDLRIVDYRARCASNPKATTSKTPVVYQLNFPAPPSSKYPSFNSQINNRRSSTCRHHNTTISHTWGLGRRPGETTGRRPKTNTNPKQSRRKSRRSKIRAAMAQSQPFKCWLRVTKQWTLKWEPACRRDKNKWCVWSNLKKNLQGQHHGTSAIWIQLRNKQVLSTTQREAIRFFNPITRFRWLECPTSSSMTLWSSSFKSSKWQPKPLKSTYFPKRQYWSMLMLKRSKS